MFQKKKVIDLERFHLLPVLECLPEEAHVPGGTYSALKACVCILMNKIFICLKRKGTLKNMNLPHFKISFQFESLTDQYLLMTLELYCSKKFILSPYFNF